MERKNAGLAEIFRLYVFSRVLPKIVSILEEFLLSCSEEEADRATVVKERFLNPFEKLAGKFSLYQQLVEHIVDMSQLPDLVVNAEHDSELQEIKEEIEELAAQAEGVLRDAKSNWAAFADVKLETDSQHGYILRTTKSDDERQLRANNSKVQILSIQKVDR